MQTCQGNQIDDGSETDSEMDPTTVMLDTMQRLPPDFLVAYGTLSGFVSYRNSQGSWFIQSLCKELNANGTEHDIMTLLTFVCQQVAVDRESYVPHDMSRHKKKQIPCTMSKLTRILKFTAK